MAYPQMIPVRQRFSDEHITDIEKAVRDELKSCGVVIRPGERIAITCGSRGVHAINRIIREIAAFVRAHGGEPFIVPAMGSHGGATAEGQRAVCEGYGVTEEFCKAPILSSMETVRLPDDELGHPVYMDKYAYESDGVIIVGRVKAHTDFHGTHESGIVKMCVIGLGKQHQALQVHSAGAYGLKHHILPAARTVLASGKIRAAVGLVENAYDKTCLVRAVLPQDVEHTDAEMLEYSRGKMPSLPVDDLDILIVDELGKDVSGTGMDTNIIGRMYIDGQEEPLRPHIRVIMVAGLTEQTHGNATGIGLADITTKKLISQIDEAPIRANTYTSTFLRRACLPLAVDTEAEAIKYAFRCSGPQADEVKRVIRIRNTLEIGTLWVSPAVWEEIRNKPMVERLEGVRELLNGEDLTPFM